MKNVLWYIGYHVLTAFLGVVTVAILVVMVFPIVMALTRHGFWWFFLWLAEPILIYLWRLLDWAIDDM